LKSAWSDPSSLVTIFNGDHTESMVRQGAQSLVYLVYLVYGIPSINRITSIHRIPSMPRTVTWTIFDIHSSVSVARNEVVQQLI